MASNAFHRHELVTVQGKSYPIVGGRLRLAHEEGLLSIQTEIVERGGDPMKEATRYVMRAFVNLHGGAGQDPKAAPIMRAFSAYGEADVTRDRKLASAILELAETRAIARALRFAGFGVEQTGAEEVSHLRGPREAEEEPEDLRAIPEDGGFQPAPPPLASPNVKAASTATPAPTAAPPAPPTGSGKIERVPPNASAPAPPAGTGRASSPAGGALCVKCGAAITERVRAYSEDKFHASLCITCQRA